MTDEAPNIRVRVHRACAQCDPQSIIRIDVFHPNGRQRKGVDLAWGERERTMSRDEARIRVFDPVLRVLNGAIAQWPVSPVTCNDIEAALDA